MISRCPDSHSPWSCSLSGALSIYNSSFLAVCVSPLGVSLCVLGNRSDAGTLNRATVFHGRVFADCQMTMGPLCVCVCECDQWVCVVG